MSEQYAKTIGNKHISPKLLGAFLSDNPFFYSSGRQNRRKNYEVLTMFKSWFSHVTDGSRWRLDPGSGSRT